MKKYLPSVYLAILALLLSLLLGKVISNSNYNTSILLSLFSIIYIFIGMFIRRVKLKHLRKEEGNVYAEFEIEDKSSFYLSVRIFFLAALLTFFVYLICYYGFDMGKYPGI